MNSESVDAFDEIQKDVLNWNSLRVAGQFILSWLISVFVLTTIIVIIILCICKRKKDSNSQAINERALPDIPIHDLEPQTATDIIISVENDNYYAPVNKPVRPRVHNPNKPHAPPPPVAVNSTSQINKLPSSSNSTVPNASYMSNEYNSPNVSHMYAEVQRHPKHPYEKLKGQSDSEHDTDEYDDPEKFRRNRIRCPNSMSDIYEPPPVPIKQNIYGDDDDDDDDITFVEQSNPQEQNDSSVYGVSMNLAHSTAGQAVAGNIASAEIPYMTPPVNQSNVITVITSQEENNFQEAPYTIISVREPLAKVRQQTKQKNRTQEFQTKHNENEHHYSEVTEEQMYAEISSGQKGTCTSDQKNLELPPAPPTVESLKSVAQAHSRQASIASTSSSGSYVPNVPISGISAPSPTDINSLYSVVDKSTKQRKTIHLCDGFSESGNKIEDSYATVRKKRVQSVRCSSEHEDNGRFEGAIDDVFALPTPIRIPHSPNENINISLSSSPNIFSMPMILNSTNLDYRQKDWIEDEPGYESVKSRVTEENEPDYEKVTGDSDDPGYEKIKRPQNKFDEPTYEQVKERKNRLISETAHHSKEPLNIDKSLLKNDSLGTSDESDPGYEQLKKVQRSDSDITDPGYEAVKRRNEDEDPDYESVKPNNNDGLNSTNDFSGTNSASFNGILPGDESEPGYESVRHLTASLEDEDPDYEQVRRAESDVDPGYERVGHHNIDDPDYEGVRQCESDGSDPNYERIDRTETDSLEPGYETVKYTKELENNTRPNSFPSVSRRSVMSTSSGHIEVSIHNNKICNFNELTNYDMEWESSTNSKL